MAMENTCDRWFGKRVRWQRWRCHSEGGVMKIGGLKIAITDRKFVVTSSFDEREGRHKKVVESMGEYEG